MTQTVLDLSKGHCLGGRQSKHFGLIIPRPGLIVLGYDPTPTAPHNSLK
ncbi:hypothetical protein [Hyphomicrobium sp. NDB2Meth4]|nr:hypothetical protein [Hyphomicrobium sp. NDB2Meth4]